MTIDRRNTLDVCLEDMQRVPPALRHNARILDLLAQSLSFKHCVPYAEVWATWEPCDAEPVASIHNRALHLYRPVLVILRT